MDDSRKCANNTPSLDSHFANQHKSLQKDLQESGLDFESFFTILCPKLICAEGTFGFSAYLLQIMIDNSVQGPRNSILHTICLCK